MIYNINFKLVSFIEEAVTYFRNLRNKYSREKKKVRQVKVSGSGSKEVDDVKSELSGMFPYLQWLDPYVKERKTKTNFNSEIQDDDASDSESEVSDIRMDSSGTPDAEISSDTSESHSATSLPQASWKFHKHTAKNSKKKKVDHEEAEFALIKSLGESIAKQKEAKDTVKQRDDNDIFGELIASQLKQLPSDRNVMVKMQISNLIYQNMMSSATHYSHNPVVMQDQGSTFMSL